MSKEFHPVAGSAKQPVPGAIRVGPADRLNSTG